MQLIYTELLRAEKEPARPALPSSATTRDGRGAPSTLTTRYGTMGYFQEELKALQHDPLAPKYPRPRPRSSTPVPLLQHTRALRRAELEEEWRRNRLVRPQRLVGY